MEIDDSLLHDCLLYIESLLSDPQLCDFYNPVKWKEWKLKNYMPLVKYPMDLMTVRINLMTNKYKAIYEFEYDVDSIWEACVRYNPSTIPIYNKALEMRIRTQRDINALIIKHRYKLWLSEENHAENLKKKIKELPSSRMQVLLLFLEDSCPECLVQKEGEIEILFNKMKESTLVEVYEYANK